MRNKQKLTEELVQQLDTELGITVDQAMRTWWHNLRKSGGMRLTTNGFDIFLNHLQLKHYDYKLQPFDLNSKLIIALDQKLQQPYYIVTKKMMPIQIVFFGSKEAMMTNLYGDLKKFIDNYTP